MGLFGSLERMYFGEFNKRILTKNVLFICIYLIITTTTSLVCGATDFDRALSYQRANESCQDVSWAINNCCTVHDVCYVLDKTQEECDIPFCQCLEEQAKFAKNSDCEQVAQEFCVIVQFFGGFAHAQAKEKVFNQTINSTLTLTTTQLPPPTTTTILSSSTTATAIASSSEIPPRKLDVTIEECFSSELKYCVAEFDTCQHKDKIELLKCEERMCQCTRAALRNKAKPECRYPIEMACIIPDLAFPSLPISESKEEPEYFLSTKIEILGFSVTILTTLIFLLITMLLISFGIWILYRCIKKRQSMPMSPSRTPLCAASSAESGLACGSNDTLSSDDGVKLARYP
uniref:Uncharacterized protein n=1 Tax=Panagrolaimus sp. PS1159 TaxID=55785 RepID=A0AC35FT83_9BILA